MTGQDLLDLYDRHARPLVGYFARRTGDPHLAVELVARTFLAAFEGRDRCRATETDGRAAWLYRIAANQLVDERRRRARERRALARVGLERRELSGAEVETIEALGEQDELAGRVEQAVSELSAEQRRAVSLRVLGGRSYPEVAAGLGISEEAARARVSRGLRALRRRIEESS